MQSDFMTDILFRTKGQIFELLQTTITQYEDLLRIGNVYSIKAYMSSLTEIADENKAWLYEAYTETISFDMYLSGASDFLSMIGAKHLDLAKYDYLGFESKDLISLFEALQFVSSATSVEDESMYLLANQAEKLLERDTLEYRTIRLICICKPLNLLNICNVIAKFIISQDSIKGATKLSISPKITE